MGTRMIHKRDKKHAAHVSKIALRMMAVLVMSGDYIPACLMGMIHRAEHRRSLQREMHWRKTYASHGFNWDSEAWNDGQCQDLLHWPRGGAEKLGRLFFLPAMQSAPGTNGVKLLQQDSDGQRCGWLAGCCLRRLRICARPAHHARTQTEHAPHRSYARAAGRVEWPAHISRVGFRHSQGRIEWPFICVRRKHRVYLSPVGRIFPLAALLSNCRACHNGGNQIADYFRATMPSLEWYLDLTR